jgi:phosphohistidine phosphatase
MTNARLLVMRHAKSDWYSGAGEDFLRPLSQRGVRDARRMGQWMAAETALPEWIVSSPSRRTRETLSLLSEGAETDLDGRTEWVDELYHSSLESILRVLKTQRERRDLMLLGHNPGVEELLNFLVEDCPQSADFKKRFPTGAVFILETGRGFDALKPGCARVIAHQRPKALAE